MIMQDIISAYQAQLINKEEASVYAREYLEQGLIQDDFGFAQCGGCELREEDNDYSNTALESASKEIVEALSDTREEVEGALIDLIKVIQNG